MSVLSLHEDGMPVVEGENGNTVAYLAGARVVMTRHAARRLMHELFSHLSDAERHSADVLPFPAAK